MKLKSNKNYTKGSIKKLKNKIIRIKVEILTTKRTTLKI
jgi:hypothetical protein